MSEYATGLVPRGARGPGARRRRRRRSNLVSSVVSAKPSEWLDAWEWYWEGLTAERIAKHRRIAAAAPPGSTLRLWHTRRAHGLATPVDEAVGRCRTTRMELGCACNDGGAAIGAVSLVRPVGCGRRLVCTWCARQAARRLGRRIEQTLRSRMYHATQKWTNEGAHGMPPATYLVTLGVRHRETLTESAAALDRAWRVFSSRIACEEGARFKVLMGRAVAKGLDEAERAELACIEAKEPRDRSVVERTRRKRMRSKAVEALDEGARAYVRARESASKRGEEHWLRQSCAVLEVAAGSQGEGHIHVHAVAVSRWIDVRKLREQWTRATCEDCDPAGRPLRCGTCKGRCTCTCKHEGPSASPVVHLSRSRKGYSTEEAVRGAAAYVAKYIAKGVETDEEGDVSLSPRTYAETMAVHVGRRMLRTSRGWWLYSEEEAAEYGLAPSGRSAVGAPVWTAKDRQRWSSPACQCCQGGYHLVTPPPPVMVAAPGQWLGRWARSMGPPHGVQLGLGPPAYQRDDGEWVRWR